MNLFFDEFENINANFIFLRLYSAKNVKKLKKDVVVSLTEDDYKDYCLRG